jgi:hypothetical protein
MYDWNQIAAARDYYYDSAALVEVDQLLLQDESRISEESLQ